MKSVQDYYPFGMLMPSRNSSSSSYGFGYNGKIKDDEISNVTGSNLDYGARIFDSRVGRWLACDPLASKYPELSPYQYCANNPLIFIDPNGKEITITYIRDTGEPITVKYTAGMTASTGNSFADDAINGLNYLNDQAIKSGGANRVNDLVNAYPIVDISYNEDFNKYSDAFIPTGYASPLKWANNVGADFEGGRTSSIVTLAHELDHAWRYISILDKAYKTETDADWENVKTFEEIAGGEDKSPALKEIEDKADSYGNEISAGLGQYQRKGHENPKSFFMTEGIKSTTETTVNKNKNFDPKANEKITEVNKIVDKINNPKK